MCACDGRVPHLRRFELRGPASDQALFSVLSTVKSDPAGNGFRVSNPNPTADGQDADWVLRHLKDTGRLISTGGVKVERGGGGRGGGAAQGLKTPAL